MENKLVKYNPNQNKADTWRHNWEVMKPFVYFGFKAMTLIAGALIGIIKLLPSLLEQHKHIGHKKDDRVIKI
ncbi:hypothetical protein [Mucilaginibacter sp.]|uniref:hypothetical protein n=1 Tax=Mucilaginibacter sp. TaxID=1882438 RepID=UPI002613C60B|nr:hypothetical protein [Mucilaginibacter sp.]MDB5031753.1 hypothetical protein [Mucilaginibacter sp.]